MPEFAFTRVVFSRFLGKMAQVITPRRERPNFDRLAKTRREASEDGGLAESGLASRGLAVRLFARNARIRVRRCRFPRFLRKVE